MNFSRIEKESRYLLERIWKDRACLCSDPDPSPFQLLNPAIAAKLLNIKYEIYEELGPFGCRQDRFEIAGMINRNDGVIALSNKFKPETMHFTGAHEIGHWILHPGEVMHRDRPLEGYKVEKTPRDPREREADYFAACFLVPRRLAIEAFEARFQSKPPLQLNDESAFWLSHGKPDLLLEAEVGSLDFALAVASARNYGGNIFDSMANQFGVSVMTMAIRLRELGLIQE